MKTFNKQCAQGENLFIKIDNFPTNEVLVEHKAKNGELIVAHSESGHHHILKSEKAVMFTVNGNPFVAYLKIDEPTELFHKKTGKDTHETILFQPGNYELRRQRQFVNKNYVRLVD